MVELRRFPVVCAFFFLSFLTEETATEAHATNTTFMSTPKPYSPCDGLSKSSCKKATNCIFIKTQGCACDKAQQVHLYGQPKSGTTWFEVILRSLTGTTSESRRIHMSDECEIINPNAGKHRLPGYVVENHPFVDPEKSYNELCRGCVKEGLQVWTESCVQPWEYYTGVPLGMKFLFILRDPRAVTISWAHWEHKENLGVEGYLDTYFVTTVPKIAAIISLRYFWHDVLVRRTNPSLIVFYEDLTGDSLNEFYRIASFLELAPDISTMSRILNDTSAASMRSQESSLPGYRSNHAKVRSASPQAFRNEVSNQSLLEATNKMRPMLHPALVAKWLYNTEDQILLRSSQFDF